MTGDLRSVTGDLRLFVPAEEGPDSWRRFCAFEREIALEARPEDSPRPAALIEWDLRREDPDTIRKIHVIEQDGAVIASLAFSRSRPGSVEYPTNRHLLSVRGAVLPQFRRRGIARFWLPKVATAMDEAGSSVWQVYVEPTAARRCLESFGAREVFSGHENRLSMADVDWPRIEEWSRLETGFRLELHEPRVPESLFESFCPAYTALARGVPMEDMEHGEWITTPDRMRDNYARLDAEGSAHHCLLAYDAEGIVGVTEYVQRPYEPGILRQDLTAVDPRAQGHGLGKLLKGTLLLHVRNLYPQVRSVVTDNAGSNAPMLSINERMGFRPHVAGSVFEMTRAELDQAL